MAHNGHRLHRQFRSCCRVGFDLGLAKLARLSQRQMERLFRAAQGCSPVRFYLRLRLERAGQLLTYTRLTVRDVGLACGFASLALFSKQYTLRYGFAPSRTRRLG